MEELNKVMDVEAIIIEPILTEKSNMIRLEEKYPKYTFKVLKQANKIQISAAVSEIFKVKVIDCNIVNVKGKVKTNVPISRSSFRRGRGRTSSWKKAIVTLDKGQKIDVFEGT